jgi:hypothetical protein
MSVVYVRSQKHDVYINKIYITTFGATLHRWNFNENNTTEYEESARKITQVGDIDTTIGRERLTWKEFVLYTISINYILL